MHGTKRNGELFPLLKYFSLTSFIFIAIVAIVLAISFNKQSNESLISFGERSNVVLTQAVSNTVWPKFKGFAPEASHLSTDELLLHPKIHQTNDLVLNHIKNTPILKVKIFDLHGKTLYSTDHSQIGVIKDAEYPGSISAKTGQIISKLSNRDTFKGVDKTHHNRQVVSSYLPIRDYDEAGFGIVGVMEVYYDVTEPFNDIKNQQYASFGFILFLLLLLYISLYLIVKRADRIIFLQSLNLKTTLEKLQEKTDLINKSSQIF